MIQIFKAKLTIFQIQGQIQGCLATLSTDRTMRLLNFKLLPKKL